MSYFNASRFH